MAKPTTPRNNTALAVCSAKHASSTPTAVAVVACSFAAATPANMAGMAALPPGQVLLQLTPAGVFGPSDGRDMGDTPAWRIDAASAQAVIARFNATGQPLVIDYEHQTLNKEKNGQPAPAAGWMRELLWIDGKGLYAVAELTARAQAQIDSKEYLYFSPVFEYHKATGTVLAMHMGALTNNPAIHGMEPLSTQSLLAAASAAFLIPTHHQEPQLNPLLKALLAALGLPDTTTETAALTALAAVGPIATLQAQANAARQALALPADATADAVTAACTSLRTATPTTPDPAKFVPVEMLSQMQTQLAALTSQVAQERAESVIAEAKTQKRLVTPEQEAHARKVASEQGVAALTAFINVLTPIAALAGTQTGGKPPTGTGATGQLSAQELAVCAAMGLSAEQFKSAMSVAA